MSDLLKSAFGYFNNPSANNGGPGGPQSGSQPHHQGGGVGGGGGVLGGSSDETSAVGDVISFQNGDQNRNVKILKLIAEGGFSYVYRGSNVASGELVAVKKMLAPDPEAMKAIEQEIEFMRQFQHDHIIKFYASTLRPSGRLKEYFIAMEYCQVQLPTPPLRLQHTSQVFAQTCKAIKYLHDFGIVHRDIKIENILIGPDGLVKLVDFGSATMEKIYPAPDWPMAKRTLLEEQIAQKTTPMYRAPEMLDLWSNHPIDEHSDMWALGCLLFALNFGQHPFQDSNKLAITNANYNLPKNVSSSNPIVCVVRGLLKVNPLERISFGQIFEVLQSIAESEGFSLNGKLPFLPAVSPTVTAPPPSVNVPVGNGAPQVNRPPPPQHQSHNPSSQGAGGSGSLFSSIKGVGSSLLKNIKEQSQQYMYGGPGGPQEGVPPPQQQQPPPPRRPPPPGGAGQHPPGGPPSRPAPPSPRQPPKSQHLEFENREYDIMQQRQQSSQPPPSRPAPPKPPPPRASPVPEPVQESVGNLLDISLDSSVNETSPASTQPSTTTTSNLLDDLFGAPPSTTATQQNTNGSFADDLLWGNSGSDTTTGIGRDDRKAEMNLLGDTSDPFASLLGKSVPSKTSPPTGFTQPTFGSQGGFGAIIPPTTGGPTLLQPGMGMPTSASFQNLSYSKPQPQQNIMGVGGMDLLGTTKGSTSSIPKNSSTPNLLSDLILDDIMGGAAKMNISGPNPTTNPPPPTAATANSTNKSNPTINQLGSNGNGNGNGKPNYNRHQIFDASPTTNAPEKKQTLNDAFGDILSSQGFASAKGGNQTRTINDLRKIDMLQNQNIDPVQLKVNEWREGKKKNIRALLASLHTVTWEGCNWKETNMSEMITPAQVKKVYRKACLAIHPDKQMGEEWEQLAKLLFVELNEAWAAFEESQQT